MKSFLAKRLAVFIATLFGASVIIFLVMEVLPGDPATIILGIDASEDAIAALRTRLGLDVPAAARYFAWIFGLMQGDLGMSYAHGQKISQLLMTPISISVPLALLAMVLTVAMALPLGLYAASRHNKAGDIGIMAMSQIGISVPSFWLGMLLVLLFAVQLGWLAPGGFPGWDAGIAEALQAFILPAVSLAIVQTAILTRVTRSSVIEIMRDDFIRTARAKGLSRRGVLWGHALRNALIPVVTIAGLQFASLITGTLVIENVFAIPGLGRTVFQAISNRDLIMVRSIVLLLAVMVLTVNFIVDMLYAVIDPRLSGRDV